MGHLPQLVLKIRRKKTGRFLKASGFGHHTPVKAIFNNGLLDLYQ